MESENAIPPEVGDVGGLLVERLRAWKHAVAYLESYITQTESVHKTLGKEYQKVLKSVDEPLREGHHFQQSVGGVASLFENIRANTVRLSTSHQETAGELKSTVLPILERLHKEIRDRQKHVQSESEKSAKSVAKTRNSTQAHIELLGQHVAAFQSSGGISAGGHDGHHFKLHHSNTGGKNKPEFDPYLLKRGILSRLVKQVHEENAQRQDLLGVQTHSQEFEAKIVQTVQQALAAFNQTMNVQADLQKQLYGDIVEKATAIPPDIEWVNFLSRNAETMIDPSAPKRTVESIRFPNEEHSSTMPLIEGALMRKGKIIRSYNQSYYVVTPSKYLHEFKDLDHLNREPEPELSLYLPDTVLSALNSEGKFQITGKDAGSKLSTKHEYAFKASSHDEGQRWYEAISACVNHKSDLAPAVTPPGGASTVAIEPPAYDKTPPAVTGQQSGVTTAAVPVVAEKAA
ncbi:hypothetical protein BZA05DRAFT_419606 [Tricharina praecox]|uniref:uncharacterized protein n=1 Tax=Tricharina praecox TaxID=43433 RepID=UPI00221E7190|nr:uncharacterized protein BZA05DRAFT_419606 [Tricharina praecox]KAI5849795.1 hypothetical protein BZA05DRAFT_419606 [Tricharina praecox]